MANGRRPQSSQGGVRRHWHALEVGYRLIDTAEMYADGVAESLVGMALGSFASNRREEVTLVSKVLPHNASKNGTIKACEASLRRMQCDYLDHYLLHWQGSHSFESTIEGFLTLQERGLIRHFGVSNFDLKALQSWRKAEERVGSPSHCQSNQVYYALNERGIEFDLLPAMNTLNIALMAYSPLGTGNLAQHAGLSLLANQHGLTAAQLALAWILRHPHAVAIPKSTHLARVEENWQASQIQLSAATLTQLDALFASPTRASRLAII
jgi:diketogulonate reductase-like aldo/keto reductase